MKTFFLPAIAALAALSSPPLLHAGEVFLKPNDVIAIVGGEDMVAANDCGYLELLLQHNFPDYHLKVRCLAWEGDTVFEQARMLNYPSLEHQLDEVGATVVICQFGQMEWIANQGNIAEFGAAYKRLVDGVLAAKGRRVAIVDPNPISIADKGVVRIESVPFVQVIGEVFQNRGNYRRIPRSGLDAQFRTFRDGCHLDDLGQRQLAELIAEVLVGKRVPSTDRDERPLLDAIASKNRLWERYRRPQNWAFLAGDRTNQPSSRDHRDPTKRWFPEEMKEFIPLIEAKDQEIWSLAAKLSPSISQ